MLKTLICIILVSIVARQIVSEEQRTRFDNHKLVRLTLTSPEHVELISVWENDNEFDVWTVDKVEYNYADVHLSPDALEKYSQLFKANNIDYKILRDNIQLMVDEEEKLFQRSFLTKANIINKFATYPEIMTFIEDIVDDNPNIASFYDFSKSTSGGRKMRTIKLNAKKNAQPVWIDCGIHAREWVSPATCVYIIEKLVSDHNSNPSKSLLNTYEFHIMPLVNPDGYEYTRTSRLWRKNRNANAGSTCIGTDLNRNYDYQWMANGGASSNPCSDTYAGSKAGSEIETQAIVDAINKRKGEWFVYLSIHSYGQWWLISFGHTTTKPADYTDMEKIGLAGAAAIQNATKDKTKFVAGQSSVMLYINSGTSQDWAKGTMGVKHSYTLELRPGQGSADASYGFQLPQDRLPNLTLETFAGIEAALEAIANQK